MPNCVRFPWLITAVHSQELEKWRNRKPPRNPTTSNRVTKTVASLKRSRANLRATRPEDRSRRAATPSLRAVPPSRKRMIPRSRRPARRAGPRQPPGNLRRAARRARAARHNELHPPTAVSWGRRNSNVGVSIELKESPGPMGNLKLCRHNASRSHRLDRTCIVGNSLWNRFWSIPF